MSRTYSDQSYGSRKTLEMPVSEVLDGTGTTLDIGGEIKVMYPMTVQDFNVTAITAGTAVASGNIVLGSKLAGTGSFVAIGTAATTSTQAIDTITDGAAAGNINAGDTLSLVYDGTSTDVLTVSTRVEVIERFVVSDA